MKKKISLALAAVICLSGVYWGTNCTAAPYKQVSVSVNGEEVSSNGVVSNGSTLIPVRSICEELGFELNYDPSLQELYISKKKKTLILSVGSAEGTYKGEAVTLSTAPVIQDGSVYIPADVITDILGYDAEIGTDGSINVNNDETEDESWKDNSGDIDLNKLSSTAEGVSFKNGVVTISKGGEFTVSGTFSGSITVDTDQKVKLKLNGVNITAQDGPAIYFKNAKKAYITLEKGTENILSDTTVYSDEDAKAVLFSNDDLEIKGSGSLKITAAYKHGIASDDTLDIENGNIEITAVGDGIHANDGINITGGSVKINAEGDGVRSEGYIEIAKGTLDITTTGEVEASQNDDFGGMGGFGRNSQNGEGFMPSGDNSQNSQSSENFMPNGNFGQSAENGQMPESSGNFMPNGELGQNGEGNENFMPRGEFGRMPENGENFMPRGEFGQMPENGENFMPQENFAQNGEMPESGMRRGSRNEMFGEQGENTGSQTLDSTANAAAGNTKNSESTVVEAAEESDSSASSKGIKADGNIIIHSGNITINSTDTCIKADSYISVDGGTLKLVSSVKKGIKAMDDLFINGGNIDIDAADEGLESKRVLTLNGGDVSVNAKDDGINAGGGSGGMMGNSAEYGEHHVIINGGSLYVNASGDGIDSNGYITVNGGDTVVYGPTNSGNSAIDSNGKISINGGTILAVGSVGMVEVPDSSSAQNVLNMAFDSQQNAGSEFKVTSSDGKVIVSASPEKTYQSVIYSSPEITKGETYTLSSNGTDAGSAEVSDTITSIGSNANRGMGGMHGGMGGRMNGMNGGTQQNGMNGGMQQNTQPETTANTQA